MPKIKRSESQRSGIKIFHDEKSGLKNQPDKRKVKKIESKKDRPVRAASLKDSPDLSASQFIKKLVEVDKQIELVYMKTLKKWDLTMNAFLALESLRDHSQGIEPACLAEDLGVQRQLVTILINDFDRRGLILKKEKQTDHRRKLLTLSKKGFLFAHEVHDYIMEMDIRAMSIFSKKEMKLMLNFHARFYDNLQNPENFNDIPIAAKIDNNSKDKE